MTGSENAGQSVMVITGPTASGKSRLGLIVAEKTEGEIVSADSRQIYRKMNVGTAKPKKDELKRIPHHLVNILDPNETCSAGEFARIGQPVIKEILGRGKLPVVVGGSGLYIDALEGNLFYNSASTERARKRLEKEGDTASWVSRLERIDPKAAARIHPNDSKRLLRALEVYETTGKTISELRKVQPGTGYKFIFFGLNWERAELYARIEQRIDQMLAEGLLEEIGLLISSGYDSRLNALDSIGYKELIPVITGDSTLDQAVAALKKNTRNLAKKQLTWFRRNTRIRWLNVNSDTDWDHLGDEVLTLFDNLKRQ